MNGLHPYDRLAQAFPGRFFYFAHCLAKFARARTDARAQRVQENYILATCFTTPRKKVSERARFFTTPQIDFPPFKQTPRSRNTVNKVAVERLPQL